MSTLLFFGEKGAYQSVSRHSKLSGSEKKDRVIAKAHFRKDYVLLELRVGKGKVSDSDFKYWKQGESNWGYTYIYPAKAIPDKVMKWIDLAKNSASIVEGDEEEAQE